MPRPALLERLGRWGRPEPVVLQLAWPVALQEVSLVFSGVLVTMMAGHLSSTAVAAIGAIESLGYLFHSLFVALGVGATVTVAHCQGAGRDADVRDAGFNALALGAAAALLLAALLWWLREPIVRWCFPAVEPALRAEALAYFGWVIASDLPTGLVVVASGVLRGMGHTRQAMQAHVAMNLLQVAAAFVLMHGVAGWPGLGVHGAGLALVAARTLGMALAVAAWWSVAGRRPSAGARPRLQRRFLAGMLRVGWPTAAEAGLFHVGKLLTQLMVAGMGTAAMAGNYVAASLVTLINIPGQALSVAATTLVGQRLGARDVAGARQALGQVLRSATLALSMLGLAVLPLSPWLAGLYGSGPAVTRTAAWLIAVNCLFMPTWAASFVLPSGLRGAGDTRYTMIVAVGSMWLCRIAAGYGLGVLAGWGVLGVWLGMHIDWMVRAALFLRRAGGDTWTRHRLLQ
ncbi:MATE family efflux transporter [Eleftheria terrae]|uniref:MATE family efflux transporter n=1 Tax=Eleftheria terrae TaxID=1597781 RepID=UPI00263ADEA6|nr:MATE family efflux transporter [Eleftheria terrae]WKB53805.1 MATE family efflux transporter [Eleftheria terrae]